MNSNPVEEPIDSWRLEVPWLPVSLNVWMRSHWTDQRRMINEAAMVMKPYLRYVLDDMGIQGPIPYKVYMEFQVFAKKVRDDDSCVVARKIGLDCMRHLNFLRQDDPTCVRSIDLPCEIDVRRPRTVITIRRYVEGL